MAENSELVVQLGIVEAQLASQVQLIKDAYIALDVLDPKDPHSKTVLLRLKSHIDAPPSGFKEFQALKGLEKAVKAIHEYDWRPYYDLPHTILKIQGIAGDAIIAYERARK